MCERASVSRADRVASLALVFALGDPSQHRQGLGMAGVAAFRRCDEDAGVEEDLHQRVQAPSARSSRALSMTASQSAQAVLVPW